MRNQYFIHEGFVNSLDVTYESDRFSIWGGHFHFITNGMQKYIRCSLLRKSIIYNLFEYKYGDDIQFENIFKINLKYVQNISLFHSILKSILNNILV